MLKISLLSLIRSKGKTLLFTLLITALTVVLSLGANVWGAIDQFLRDADDFYTTIAVLEYLGPDYPQDVYTDPTLVEALTAFDKAALLNDPAILSWNEPERAYAYIDGYRRMDNFMPDKRHSLLVVSNPTYTESYGSYAALVVEALYSAEIKDNARIILDKSFGYFEPGQYYIVHGQVATEAGMLTRLKPLEFDLAAAKDGGIQFPPMLKISTGIKDGPRYEVPEVYRKAADTMRVISNAVLIQSVKDLKAFYPFHQEELYMLKGRGFTDAEYAGGARVAVVPERLANFLEKEVGDSLELSISLPDKGGSKPYYWAGNGFVNHERFEIVGITNTILGQDWQIYVPSSAGVPAGKQPIGYTVGWAVIDNRQADAFFLRTQAQLPDRFMLTLYDQGYSSTAIPFNNILKVAQLVTLLCALVELVVLIFFGYVFIYRQRETGQTMLMLGTGTGKVIAYFLISAGVLALIGALAGAFLGHYFSESLLTWVAETAKGSELIDPRFSNSNLSFVRSLEFAPRFGLDFFLKVGLVVFLTAMLSCIVFVIRAFTLSAKKKKSGQKMPSLASGTSTLKGGSGKYAWLSTLRGGMRSLVVLALALAVVIFFGQLSSTALRYNEELSQIYQNSVLRGRYTDFRGKQIGDQLIDGSQVLDLFNSGKISHLALSTKFNALYLGTPLHQDGRQEEVAPYITSANIYVYESQEELFRPNGMGSTIIAINDILRAPEFFYSDNVQINFLDGYDESVFAAPPGDPELKTAVVSSGLVERVGASLGDTIRFALWVSNGRIPYPGQVLDHLDFKIIGTYTQQGASEMVYLPLAAAYDTSLIWGSGQRTDIIPPLDTPERLAANEKNRSVLQDQKFNSASFTLNDAREIVPLKEYLHNYGYSQVNRISKIRTWVVLDDAALNHAVASIQQQISYINRLYPVLVLLSGLIAVVVSWLLGVNRRMEMAIMQGLGTPGLRIFLSFFLEQAALCLLGILLGGLIWLSTRGMPSDLHLYLVLGFLACYLLGSAISIISTLNRNLLNLLADKE